MLKQFWIIRSLRSLFWGLSFAASGIQLLYTLLSIAVLDLPERWKLLGWPAASCAICLLLYLLFRRRPAPPAPLCGGHSPSPLQRERFFDMLAGICFLGVLFCFFCAMEQMNRAKGIDSLPAWLPWCVLAALVFYLIGMCVCTRRSRRDPPDAA